MFILYETTNTVNGRVYAGIHEQDSDKFDGYLGSGKLLVQAVKKYGAEKFVRRTLATRETREEILSLEAQYVDEDYLARSDTYNLTLGGSAPPKIQYWSEEAREAFIAKFRIASHKGCLVREIHRIKPRVAPTGQKELRRLGISRLARQVVFPIMIQV